MNWVGNWKAGSRSKLPIDVPPPNPPPTPSRTRPTRHSGKLQLSLRVPSTRIPHGPLDNLDNSTNSHSSAATQSLPQFLFVDRNILVTPDTQFQNALCLFWVFQLGKPFATGRGFLGDQAGSSLESRHADLCLFHWAGMPSSSTKPKPGGHDSNDKRRHKFAPPSYTNMDGFC